MHRCAGFSETGSMHRCAGFSDTGDDELLTLVGRRVLPVLPGLLELLSGDRGAATAALLRGGCSLANIEPEKLRRNFAFALSQGLTEGEARALLTKVPQMFCSSLDGPAMRVRRHQCTSQCKFRRTCTASWLLAAVFVPSLSCNLTCWKGTGSHPLCSAPRGKARRLLLSTHLGSLHVWRRPSCAIARRSWASAHARSCSTTASASPHSWPRWIRG
jgi:hypothetical protein